jgi:hypothetical protein
LKCKEINWICYQPRENTEETNVITPIKMDLSVTCVGKKNRNHNIFFVTKSMLRYSALLSSCENPKCLFCLDVCTSKKESDSFVDLDIENSDWPAALTGSPP